MRHRSSKQAALYRKFTPERQAFLEEMGRCAVCGTFGSLSCHEILAGAHRTKAFQSRCCWLALCWSCHVAIQSTDIKRQLAYKLLSDAKGFDLPKFHEVWGRPETAITPADILATLQTLMIERSLQW